MNLVKKTFAFKSFSAVVIISLSALLLLTGCPGGGTGGPLAFSGTVQEQFDPLNPPAAVAGDVVSYVSPGGPITATTDAMGQCGPVKVSWDHSSLVSLAAFNSVQGSIDEIIYNKLATPAPNIDLLYQQFLLTKPGTGTGAIIPVVITAQKPDQTPYGNATVQINDAGSNPVGMACATDASGACNYSTQLAANAKYTISVVGSGGSPTTQFPFTTSPIAGTSGTICRLRIFARF